MLVSHPPSLTDCGSNEDLFHHAGLFVVGEGEGGVVALERQLGVVEAEKVEEGGVVVVMAHGFSDGFVSKLIGFAVDTTGFETASGDPHSESVGVVIPSDDLPTSIMLNHGESPHFTAPMDNGGIEESACFQIHDECGGTSVHVLTCGG